MNKLTQDIGQHNTIASLLVINQSIQELFSTRDALTPLLMHHFLVYKVFPTDEHQASVFLVLQQLQQQLKEQLSHATDSDQEDIHSTGQNLCNSTILNNSSMPNESVLSESVSSLTVRPQTLYTPALGYILALLEEEQILPDDLLIDWTLWDNAIFSKALSSLKAETYCAAKHSTILQTIHYLIKRSTNPMAMGYLRAILDESLPFFNSHYLGLTRAEGISGKGIHKANQLPAQVSLGLSTGIAANLLTLLNAYKVCPHEAIMHTIRQGISYVLSFRRNIDFSEGIYSAFPDTISSGYAQSHFTNALTWQSGDLVHALVFYQAAEIFQDPQLENLANLIGLNTLLCTDEQTTQITDSSLEKGSAGLALMYHFAYLTSKNTAYQHGCTYWLKYTLDHWTADAPLTPPLTDKTISVKEGLLGVAFVLAYISYEKKNTWLEWLIC